jgi:AraC family transcriptional activator of pobA
MQPGWQSTFDFEWIPIRSGRYNWRIQPHTHDALVQVLLLLQGAVELQMDHARISERAPCLILIPAQTVHGFQFASDTDGPVVTAAQRPLESLARVIMPELVEHIRKPLVMSLASRETAIEALMPIFLAIERESRRSSIGQVAAALSLITALLVQVARLRQADAATPVLRDSRKHGQIQKFRALVDARFKQHLPLRNYADELGITVGQLTRLCREVLGMSSLAVLHARLVHEAQRDLVYTDMSVKRLAGDLGFVDEAYFGRFFRKHTGLTPREFRTQARNSMR